DRIGYESHQRAARAIDEGRFEKEIVPIELDVPAPDSGSTLVRTRFAVDEAVRRETTLEKMAALQPAFIPDGVVTAGNSSQIVDGSAAVLVASEAKASELGLEPRARFVSFGVVGVDPHLMLHGNPEASAKALAKAGLTWDEIDVIEVNEAFASVVAQFLADTGLQERYEAGDVNPNGGGISLGHPLGATGARITGVGPVVAEHEVFAVWYPPALAEVGCVRQSGCGGEVRLLELRPRRRCLRPDPDEAVVVLAHRFTRQADQPLDEGRSAVAGGTAACPSRSVEDDDLPPLRTPKRVGEPVHQHAVARRAETTGDGAGAMKRVLHR